MNELKNKLSTEKRSMLFLLLSSVLSGVMIIIQAYLFVAIVDSVFLQGKAFTEILPFLGGLLLVMLARTMFNYLNGRTGVKLAAKVKSDFRKSLLNKFSNSPVEASLRGQSGRKVSVMLDAVDEIDSYFSQYIPQMIQTSFIPLLILIVVFTQHINSGLIMVITAPFIPVFMVIIGMQTKKKSEEQLDKLAAFSGTFLDTLQGLTTLKLFGKAKQQKEEIQRSSLGFRKATMEILKVAFTNSFMLEVITMLSIGIVALELAIQLIIYESISFFTAFFVLVLVPEFYTSLKELGNAFHNGRSSMGAAKKVEDELADDEQGITWGEASFLSETTPPIIELKDAGFSYGEGKFALDHIRTEIPAYGQVAIVGRTGSGKTTLLHGIAGLMAPSKGDIHLNGKPMAQYKEQDWFDQLSYISQHPYIFSGTIAQNIAVGANFDATQAEIEQAAEQAGISVMIKSLEKAYETFVGEGGRGLSGGEMQRLAIARAFLKKPTVILFDEPTTGLDLQTESILQESMHRLAQDATVITVAHRLHTIKNADTILFLENGRLVASGTHTELIETVREYRDMVTVQQGGDAS
ncbi:thiol reductant ABC exporter subunit CydD [Virgibacillus ainsalahensis]